MQPTTFCSRESKASMNSRWRISKPKNRIMKKITVKYLQEIMEGCKSNNYQSICKAGRLVSDLAAGHKDIEVEDRMKSVFKTSLYRKFMRAYTRYILANPNSINHLAVDCSFTSMADGEYTGIEE